MTDKLDFIWTERAIDIKVKPLYVNKQNLNITFDQGFNFLINDDQNKLKRPNTVTYQFNYNGFTIKGSKQFKNSSLSNSNKLFKYFPKVKSLSKNKENNNFKLNDFKMKVNKQYNSIKKYFTDLNPVLNKYPSLKQQFLFNFSNGNEERFYFYNNLYGLINNLNSKDKILVKNEDNIYKK